MASTDINALIGYLNRQRLVVDFTYMCGNAIFIYDYILTLHREVTLIWFAPWSYTKVLFLLVRYMGLANLGITSHLQFTVDQAADSCARLFPVPAWSITLHLIVADIVLAIRTWAVWRQNRYVGIGLGFVSLSYFVVQCTVSSIFVHSLGFASPPYPGFRGCYISRASTIFWGSWLINSVAESIVLVLMCISAFRLYRQGSRGELAHVIHRDGILFYVYLLVVNFASIMLRFTTTPDLMIALTPLEDILYSVLTCRIVLNIRGVSHRSIQTELHTAYHEQPPPPILLRPIVHENLGETMHSA